VAPRRRFAAALPVRKEPAVAWRKVRFKEGQVLARCNEQGELAANGGRVEIRYRATDARAYHAAARNLAPIDQEILPDATCVPAVDADSGAAQTRGGANRGSAGKASQTGGATVPEGAIVAYADGACSGNPGPCGAGIVLIDGRSRRELSAYLGEGTNNIAELTAIELAIAEIEAADRPVRIFTDSQYSIGVLSKGWKAKANVALIARVRVALKRFSDLQLIYVRGHSGVLLNERADVLAVQAVQERATSGWVQVSS
jgi:ribonuclease HI